MEQKIHDKNSPHKYKKIRFPESKFAVFKCTIPGCAHYIRPELILGRKSVCWRCNEEFIVTDNKIAKQICENCRSLRRKKKKVSESTIETLMNLIGGN